MSDTIELLETIGRNAMLRHASARELAAMLEQAKASEVFKSAVATGDSTLLSKEFGPSLNQVPQITHVPGYEEDQPDQNDDDVPSDPTDPARSTSPTAA